MNEELALQFTRLGDRDLPCDPFAVEMFEQSDGEKEQMICEVTYVNHVGERCKSRLSGWAMDGLVCQLYSQRGIEPEALAERYKNPYPPRDCERGGKHEQAGYERTRSKLR